MNLPKRKLEDRAGEECLWDWQ